MDTKELLQKATSFFETVRRGYAGDIKPGRDWNILLLFMLVGLIVSAGVNAFLFTRVYEGEPLTENVSINPQARETEEIEKRLEGVDAIFEERALEYSSYIETTYPFVDPARN
ncbi:MAG: hypothetical protein ACJKSS_00915 [Patescibacteria group bacterium UBA2103]